jgi:hypothetical protein
MFAFRAGLSRSGSGSRQRQPDALSQNPRCQWIEEWLQQLFSD